MKAITEKAIIKTIILKLIKEREKKFLKNKTHIQNKAIKKLSKTFLSKLKGILILYKSIKPVITVKHTHKVEVSISEKLKIEDNIITIKILQTIVNAVGSERFKTFTMIFPLIFSLFASKANTNDGIPIVTILISVNCIGTKG